jgi:hypothetical protein
MANKIGLLICADKSIALVKKGNLKTYVHGHIEAISLSSLHGTEYDNVYAYFKEMPNQTDKLNEIASEITGFNLKGNCFFCFNDNCETDLTFEDCDKLLILAEIHKYSENEEIYNDSL